MGMWKDLPVEILQNILNLIDKDEDQNTLYNCTFVCKNWARSTQQVLYLDVRIGIETNFNKFLNTLECNPPLGSMVRKFKGSKPYSPYDQTLQPESIKDYAYLEKLFSYLPLLEEFEYPKSSCKYLPLLNALIESKLPKLKKIIPSNSTDIADSQIDSYISCALLIKNRIESLVIKCCSESGVNRQMNFHRLFDSLDQFKQLNELYIVDPQVENQLEFFKKVDRAHSSLQDITIFFKDVDNPSPIISSNEAKPAIDTMCKYVPRHNVKRFVCKLAFDDIIVSYIIQKYPQVNYLALVPVCDPFSKPVLCNTVLRKLIIYLSKMEFAEIHGLPMTSDVNELLDAYNMLCSTSKTLQHVEFNYCSQSFDNDRTGLGILKTLEENSVDINISNTDEHFKSSVQMPHTKLVTNYGSSIKDLAIKLDTSMHSEAIDKMLSGQFVIDVFENCPNIRELRIYADHIDPNLQVEERYKKKFKIHFLHIKCRRRLYESALKNFIAFFASINHLAVSTTLFYPSSNVAFSPVNGIDLVSTIIGTLTVNYQFEENLYLRLCTELEGERYYKFKNDDDDLTSKPSNKKEYTKGIKNSFDVNLYIVCKYIKKLDIISFHSTYVTNL